MFEKIHATLADLRNLFAGRATSAEEERAAAHLLDCRSCRLLAVRAIAAQEALGGIRVSGSLRTLADFLSNEKIRLAEGLEAQAAWAAIRPLSPKARRDKVRLARNLHTLPFLKTLLEAGTTAGTATESEEILQLALLVAGQLPATDHPSEIKNDYCAECCAEIANARRRQANWLTARDSLKKGDQHSKHGLRNGVAEARLLCVGGAIEFDLGNPEEAAKILRRAAALFEANGEIFLQSRTLAQLAYTLVEVAPAESLQLVEGALELIPAEHPRLALFAEGIRIDCLLEIGAPGEAMMRFEAQEGLFAEFREPFIQLRRWFTAARIMDRLQFPRQAERLFHDVIAGDLEHGMMKDFFLDLVDLLSFYLRRGQKQDAIEVCRRALQELRPQDDDGGGEASREQMREVWRDLEEAIKKGQVDLGVPAVLRSYIKAHWRTPAPEPPSFTAGEE
ncbi:MAG TPA: hypothetical protein DD490_33980 [Acidobacteria bacterium]|nr:hypothetical protein [Acidobacteriota bacterium]